MRVLANENFPKAAVDALHTAGHEVVWVREAMPGATDTDVTRFAVDQKRVLVTFDKDFGELVFRIGVAGLAGVILFRTLASSPDEIARRVLSVLTGRDDWEGHFSVVEPGRIRMVRLPG